jgi:cobalt-zinc-cadmium efflux system outer membrane protein
MRPTIAAIVVLVFSVGVLDAQTPPLTLEAALRAARDSNRLLQAARLRILEARGDLTGASLRLADNPEIAGAAGPRLPGRPLGDRTTDIELGIEQRFETGGQRGFRLERAQAAVDAAAAGAADVQRVVDLAVARTFYETLAGERRLALLEQNETLARDLHGVATRRLDAGEGTPLEVNTARIRLADVERRAILAGRDLPPEYRDEIARLLSRLQAAVSGGEGWLTRADGLELAAHNLRQRVRQVYGIETRPD